MPNVMSCDERKPVTLQQLLMRQVALNGTSDWITVDQGMLNDFASITGDDAFIHTDPARAIDTRFHGTIAHGLLILSLLPQLMRTALPNISDRKMGVNYGYDRVRFISPVPVTSSIRGRFSLEGIVQRSPKFYVLTYQVTVEIKDTESPALTARWLLGALGGMQ